MPTSSPRKLMEMFAPFRNHIFIGSHNMLPTTETFLNIRSSWFQPSDGFDENINFRIFGNTFQVAGQDALFDGKTPRLREIAYADPLDFKRQVLLLQSILDQTNESAPCRTCSQYSNC